MVHKNTLFVQPPPAHDGLTLRHINRVIEFGHIISTIVMNISWNPGFCFAILAGNHGLPSIASVLSNFGVESKVLEDEKIAFACTKTYRIEQCIHGVKFGGTFNRVSELDICLYQKNQKRSYKSRKNRGPHFIITFVFELDGSIHEIRYGKNVIYNKEQKDKLKKYVEERRVM